MPKQTVLHFKTAKKDAEWLIGYLNKEFPDQTRQEQFQKFLDRTRKMLSLRIEHREGYTTMQIIEEDDYFNCTLLCRKQRSCNSVARNIIGEVDANHCFKSAFPYIYKGHTVCKYMMFEENFSNNPQKPYPTCVAKQKDVPFQLPKNRVMENPQFCWSCYKLQKKMKEQRIFERATGTQPRVNWYPTQGFSHSEEDEHDY